VLLVDGLGSSTNDSSFEALSSRVSKLPVVVHRFSYAGYLCPTYSALDTIHDFSAPRQLYNMLDYVQAMRPDKRLIVIGFSLGGLLISHLLCDSYLETTLLDKIACVILIGAPIEGGTVLVDPRLADGAVVLKRILQGFDSSAQQLYKRFPRLVQLLGQKDEIVNRRRSGIDIGHSPIAYPIPPICVPEVGHFDLPSHERTIDVVESIVRTCVTGGFAAVVESFNAARPFNWECDIQTIG
jgi:pimeloyl-ACP methyl ester carboxylesterase